MACNSARLDVLHGRRVAAGPSTHRIVNVGHPKCPKLEVGLLPLQARGPDEQYIRCLPFFMPQFRGEHDI